MASTIFVIDSSPAVRRMVEQISTPAGYDVIGFQDGPAALEAARALTPRLIIADYHLDNMTFSGFCKEVQKLDCLAETYIISLIGAADRPDESHLRSLGVKAFLKKPFQTEHLLELIKDLDQTSAARANGTKKRRAWPPVSSATDFEDEDGGGALTDADQTGEIEAAVIPAPVPAKIEPEPALQQPKPPDGEPEETMTGLFAQLLQSLSEKAEKRIADTVPDMIGKELAGRVAQAVEAEVSHQLGATVTQERLTQILEPLLRKELPGILSREVPELEPIIRHSIVEIAGPLVKDHVEHVMREQADNIRAAVPDAVREHLKTMEGQIQDEIRKAVIAQTQQLEDGAIRETVNDQIKRAVETIVPDIAEEQIKMELRRLMKAA